MPESVFCACRHTLAELEDGPQMYEAMYNIQARSQQAIDSGTLFETSTLPSDLFVSHHAMFFLCSSGGAARSLIITLNS